jgi:hypothetical protein
MSYELTLPTVWTGINKQTGRFLKGHVPANKGKKWDDYMSKRAQKRAMKGWRNLDIHRNKNGRADTAGRCRKQVVAVMDDGSWLVFSYIGAAAAWLGGIRENIGRCCRLNRSGVELSKPPGKVNTDHRYKGIRWYFENDNKWTTKIK